VKQDRYSSARAALTVAAYLMASATPSCSKPQDVLISAEPSGWDNDTKLKDAVSKLSEDDRLLLGRWMLRAAMGKAFGAKVADTTIGSAINQQRVFEQERAAKEAEEAALAARVEEERKAATAAMNAVLTVAMTKFEFFEADFRNRVPSDGFQVGFALENRSSKDLAGVKGRVHFSDTFDDQIKSIGLSVDEPIPAGQVLQWGGVLDYNQFMASDKKLRATPRSKLKVAFVPDVFLFADGTRMTTPK
jgi:hypothetical protein